MYLGSSWKRSYYVNGSTSKLKINILLLEFSQTISLNCCVIRIRHSLASLRIQRAENDSVDGVVSPKEQPAGGDKGCHTHTVVSTQ